MSTDLTKQQVRNRPARRSWVVATATVAAAALAIFGVLSLTGDPAPAAPPLELSLGEGDAMLTCLAFEVGVLADMPLAFEGTVTDVAGDRVTLTVDHWYRGGDAAEVSLIGPAGMEALIGGIAFETGGSYLISAQEGTVNYCGYSGEATGDLRAGFDQAFGN